MPLHLHHLDLIITKMAKLLIFITPLVVFLVMTLAEGRYGTINEVYFYEKPVCSGHHYAIPLGNGKCQQIPAWLSEEGWKLSVDPRGNCIKIYDNPHCRESVAPAAYSFDSSDSRADIIRRCRSTRELGFRTVRSFRSQPC